MTSGKGASDSSDHHSRKKGKVIQPLHSSSISKFAKQDNSQKSNADILAELAKKTAELAEQVKGTEKPVERVLTFDEPADPEAAFLSATNPLEEVTNPNDSANSEKNSSTKNVNAAADIIRAKLNKIFKDEPNAATEAAESVAIGAERSAHQEYMYQLTTSGKSLAEIQTKWHEYYTGLSDDEKHKVWQEFYKNQHAMSAYSKHVNQKQNDEGQRDIKASNRDTTRTNVTRSVADIKEQLFDKVSAGGKLKPVHHLKSALFGIGLAGFVGLIISFVFFNEVFVAPFISPSKTVSATPIIGNNQADIGPDAKIIIPKINLEVPVVYGLKTVEEKDIQQSLEEGVVHYAASPEPGEVGNSVIVGHSSNNILNSGKYKFAFVLLKRMEVGDTFFIHKDSVRYTYKVFEKKIVAPSDVSVLGPSERENTMTLITCDPPGTSLNRLIIVAEQISPDTTKNTTPTIDVDTSSETELPSNAPSLWSRINPF